MNNALRFPIDIYQMINNVFYTGSPSIRTLK